MPPSKRRSSNNYDIKTPEQSLRSLPTCRASVLFGVGLLVTGDEEIKSRALRMMPSRAGQYGSWNAPRTVSPSSRVSLGQEPREVLLPESTTAVAAGHSHTLCLAESGNVWAVGSNARGQLGTGSASLPQLLPRRIAALSGALLPLISPHPLSLPFVLAMFQGRCLCSYMMFPHTVSPAS